MMQWYLFIPILVLGVLIGYGYGVYIRHKDFSALKEVAQHYHDSMKHYHDSMKRWAEGYFDTHTELTRAYQQIDKLLKEEAHWQAEKVLLKVALVKAASSQGTKESEESEQSAKS